MPNLSVTAIAIIPEDLFRPDPLGSGAQYTVRPPLASKPRSHRASLWKERVDFTRNRPLQAFRVLVSRVQGAVPLSISHIPVFCCFHSVLGILTAYPKCHGHGHPTPSLAFLRMRLQRSEQDGNRWKVRSLVSALSMLRSGRAALGNVACLSRTIQASWSQGILCVATPSFEAAASIIRV